MSDQIAALRWRTAEGDDAPAVSAAIDAWWPGRHIVHMVCPQLFEHFGDTCLLVEDENRAEGDRLVAFLLGMLSQRMPAAGYIHYAGVRPEYRGTGLGRKMYETWALRKFFFWLRTLKPFSWRTSS